MIRNAIFVIVFFAVALVVILFARGYRVNISSNKLITPTGIVAVYSNPKGAKIYVNNKLQGLSDTNLSLSPGIYQITIKKEGYFPWSKTIAVQGEIVYTINPNLYSINTTLAPLTNIGVERAVTLGKSGEKILLYSANVEDGGFFIYETGRKGLGFFPPLSRVAKANLFPEDFDIGEAELSFSPDFRQVIVDTETAAYLLSLTEENTFALDITQSKDSILDAWTTQRHEQEEKIIGTLPQAISKVATTSAKIRTISTDGYRILYEATDSATIDPVITPPLIGANQTPEERNIIQNKMYLYDKKEDKNFPLVQSDENIILDPDYKRIVIYDTNTIKVADYDGTNEHIVYSGPYDPSFVSVAPNGKIIILTNFNPKIDRSGDLYAIGIQ